MNKIIYVLIAASIIVSCAKTTESHDHDHSAMEADSTNTILYNQVMDIHDEVMPKMDDLYNLKKDLQAKLQATPLPSGDIRKDLEVRIARVDSASKLMYDWMHEFNPPADSADQEQTRTYLESEMEKVKQVKLSVNRVLADTLSNR